MLLSEWNMEEAIAVGREEGLEEGLEKGIEKGIRILVSTLKGLMLNQELVSKTVAEKFSITIDEAME